MRNLPKHHKFEHKRKAFQDIREKIPRIVNELALTCHKEENFDHVGPDPIPSRDAIIDIIHRTRRLLYPGYFIRYRLDDVNLGYYLGEESTALYEALSEQITLALRHECIRNNRPIVECEEMGHKLAIWFLGELPGLRQMLAKDVRAAYEGDPAAKSYDEIIFSYPGLHAITIYRIANKLHAKGVPMLPRIMTEHAHSETGIDIHPGANIREGFFIDHGTGVVVGETTDIGNRVRLYQGVTLGALSVSKEEVERLRNEKRHPTLEDDVIVYSGATILGNTVIGANSVIGGNVWLTESVPPNTKIFLKKPELIYKDSSAK
jgi:serine O-acetyltransferase